MEWWECTLTNVCFVGTSERNRCIVGWKYFLTGSTTATKLSEYSTCPEYAGRGTVTSLVFLLVVGSLSFVISNVSTVINNILSANLAFALSGFIKPFFVRSRVLAGVCEAVNSTRLHSFLQWKQKVLRLWRRFVNNSVRFVSWNGQPFSMLFIKKLLLNLVDFGDVSFHKPEIYRNVITVAPCILGSAAMSFSFSWAFAASSSQSWSLA